MKLGTDAVLLGCLVEAYEPQQLLDIGTGSGIIALQLAQRFQSAHITGVEIEAQAAAQAQRNFEKSAWSNRLQAIAADITTFAPGHAFDLICSNPPFYANGFPIFDAARNTARTQEQLSFEDLVRAVDRLLSPNGRFWVILPIAGWNVLKTSLQAAGFSVVVEHLISAKTSQAPNRVVAAAARQAAPLQQGQLSIRHADNTFTDEYRRLTQDFYLHLK